MRHRHHGRRPCNRRPHVWCAHQPAIAAKAPKATIAAIWLNGGLIRLAAGESVTKRRLSTACAVEEWAIIEAMLLGGLRRCEVLGLWSSDLRHG